MLGLGTFWECGWSRALYHVMMMSCRNNIIVSPKSLSDAPVFGQNSKVKLASNYSILPKNKSFTAQCWQCNDVTSSCHHHACGTVHLGVGFLSTGQLAGGREEPQKTGDSPTQNWGLATLCTEILLTCHFLVLTDDRVLLIFK